MICPHCSTAVKFSWNYSDLIKVNDDSTGIFLLYDTCANCQKVIVHLVDAKYNWDVGHNKILTNENGDFDIKHNIRIFPNYDHFSNTEYIPKLYFEDYEESIKVLSTSPKASAALSRRLLQLILREQFKIEKRTLSQEIVEFIALDGIPSHLSDAIDAIRNIGNFAAHPSKDNSTGEIIPVEPGEAEWLIEVNEALLDFTFVQPKKLEERRNALNEKLNNLGKPKMKTKTTDNKL